ncbi:MAG: hypothetical protein AAGJ73_13390 [Pseudomonadota bacterium]
MVRLHLTDSRIWGALLCLHSSPVSAADRLICYPKAYSTVQNDGKLGPAFEENTIIKRRYHFDQKSGELTVITGVHERKDGDYDILEKGGRSNALVAIDHYEGAARSGVDLLRIDTWKDPMTFQLHQSGAITSGTCEAK